METVLQVIDVLAKIATVIAACGVLIALRQLHAQRTASRTQNMIALVQFLSQKEFSTARRVVRLELSKKTNYDQWTDDDKASAALVCGSFDSAGMLIKLGFARLEDFLYSWRESVHHLYD